MRNTNKLNDFSPAKQYRNLKFPKHKDYLIKITTKKKVKNKIEI